jgi:hypothetical protein
MLDPKDDFELPVFNRPLPDPPCTVPYEVAVRAFEEIAEAFHLQDKSRPAGNIPEFKM